MSELLEAPLRQRQTLETVAHRPWPLPEGPWLMGQTWQDLLFAHWRVEPERLRPLVPEGLELDAHDGSAWLGITAFLLAGLRLHGFPPLPYLSTFPELNVRTYVSRGGRPGVWFFTLDASSRLAVEGGRRAYRLPYHRARQRVERGERIRFESGRPEGKAFSASYRGRGDFFAAVPGTLEHFLVERYCLYACDGGELWTADVHHPPWPLQRADAEIELNTMAPEGVQLGEGPLLHYAARQDALIWPLRRA